MICKVFPSSEKNFNALFSLEIEAFLVAFLWPGALNPFALQLRLYKVKCSFSRMPWFIRNECQENVENPIFNISELDTSLV